MSKEWLQPVPRSLVWDLLQFKLAQIKERKLEKLPYEYCVVSYLYDMQSESGVKANADYARMWGWSESWVSRNIGKIKEQADEQASFYREEAKQDPSKGHARVEQDSECDEASKNADCVEESKEEARPEEAKSKGEARVTQGSSKTYYTESLDKEINSHSTRAREDSNPARASPLSLYRQYFPDERLVIFQQEVLSSLTDLDVLEHVLETWKANNYQPGNIGSIKDRYHNEKKRRDEAEAPEWKPKLNLHRPLEQPAHAPG